MKTFFAILSVVLALGATVPYAIDIVKGRVRPARSTRVLFLLLMAVTLVVQSREFTSGVLLLTAAEVLMQLVLFILSIKRGVGGLARLDLICYVAFAVSLTSYLITQNAVLALILLALTDTIAFIPTIVKIWRDPSSETWIFFVVGGVLAAGASLMARNSNNFTEVFFPAYLVAINAIAAIPILLHKKRSNTLDR